MAEAFTSDSLSSGGAESKEYRRKRAWRKPREPVTPEMGSDEKERVSTARPIKLRRDEASISGATSGSFSSSTSKCKDTLVTTEVKDVCVASVETVDMKGGLPLIMIDGSIMEGGGQILRISMMLSCLLNHPIHISHIRAGRSNPGLRAQHMTGLHLLADICGGSLDGAQVGSSEVSFHPQAVAGGEFVADTKTAGSTGLLLQAALPVLLFAQRESKVTLRGGTNADMAPPIDYFLKVFQVIAKKFGVVFDCHINRRGFYPKGRGEVIYSSSPIQVLSPVNMTERGKLVKVELHAYTAGSLPKKVGHQMVQSARRVIEGYLTQVGKSGVAVVEEFVAESPATAFGNGSGIIVVAETSTGCLLAGSANGRKNDPAEVTGRSAAKELVKDLSSGGCVDQYLQDQLMILMALAKGRSRLMTGPLSLHTKTAIHIIEKMTQGKAKFEVEQMKDGMCIIQCEGIGLETNFNQHH